MRIAPIFIAALLLAATLPACAGSFDGKWLADIPTQNDCDATSTMTLMVADGNIIGQIQNPANVVSVTGTVDDDGNANFIAQGHFPGTMKFTDRHFDATWFNGACNRHAEGDRAPDSAQQAAAANERKQHQVAFADLVQRAQVGEKISYQALRAESIYAENWDFNGNRIDDLINEALVAAKGKDCTAALAKTEEVIKLDFTVIDAHQIRADCLKDSDRAQSRIEQRIADGLWNSLTDSGDGQSVRTAYIVATWHDEARLLDKQGYDVRTRQTELRNSNGNYYDIFEAKHSYTNANCFAGLCSGSSNTRTFFFDVSLYVAGRNSKRAADAVAASNMQ